MLLKDIRTNNINQDQFPLTAVLSLLLFALPPHRKKHVSTLLNVRGMMRQAERQEILNIVKDFERSSAHLGQNQALFSDIPITSEIHCIRLGFLRLAMSISNWFSEHRPQQRRQTSVRSAMSQLAGSMEDTNKVHKEE